MQNSYCFSTRDAGKAVFFFFLLDDECEFDADWVVCMPLENLNENQPRAEEMNRLLFELLARWVSGLIPGCALLHIMCKTKKPGDDRPPVDRNRCVFLAMGVGLHRFVVRGLGRTLRQLFPSVPVFLPKTAIVFESEH